MAQSKQYLIKKAKGELDHETSEIILSVDIEDTDIELSSNKRESSKFFRIFPKNNRLALFLDYKTVKQMASGTCIIPSNQEKGDMVIVCKEGESLKIFQVVEEIVDDEAKIN